MARALRPISAFVRRALAPLSRVNPLFDAAWYLARYPDVRAGRYDAWAHYRRHGVAEGRDPNAFFSTDWYLRNNPDAVRSGMNPLDHYLKVGAAAGNDPSPRFDTDWYLDQNPGVRKAGINPLLHYLRSGANEGRAPHPISAVELPAVHRPAQSPPEPVPDAVQRDASRGERQGMGTIVVIDDQVPQYDRSAGGLAMSQYVRLLAGNDLSVVFIPHDRQLSEPHTSALRQAGVDVLDPSVDVEAWFQAHGATIDWVLLARPAVASAYIDLVRKATRARLMYFTHDLAFLREARRADVEERPDIREHSQRLKRVEVGILTAVDAVLTPSAEEARIVMEFAPKQDVHVIPLHFYSEANLRTVGDPPLEGRREIIFVGGFQHAPNVDAATFLIEQVMPIVWRSVSDARVLLVGADPPLDVVALAGPLVEVAGHVSDLEPLYRRARMSVNPIRYGAGVKGKVLASLAAGVPVVATSVANEGIDLISGEEALIADDAEGLARHVVALFADGSMLSRLAERGQRVITERFSEEAMRSAMLGALYVEVP